MADADWGEDGGAGPRKRRVSSWVWWGCGGGCLLMTLVGMALAILFGRVVHDALDPEKAWEGVREILAYEERPEGWHAVGNTVMGVGFYTLTPPRSDALLLVQTFPGPGGLESLLDPDSPRNEGFLLLEALRDPEPGTIDVQGRETRCLRFQGGVPEALGEGSVRGSGIRIDVTGQGVPTLVQISLASAEEPVGAERVAELLAPFDVWRGR